jgi:hypothetical protein
MRLPRFQDWSGEKVLNLVRLSASSAVPSQNLIRAHGNRELAGTAGYVAVYFEVCQPYQGPA